MCKLIEGNLKPFGFMKGEGLSCLAHSWLSNKHVLVAGDGGKVYLFEEAELKTVYNMAELAADVDSGIGQEVDITEKRALFQMASFIFLPLFVFVLALLSRVWF